MYCKFKNFLFEIFNMLLVILAMTFTSEIFLNMFLNRFFIFHYESFITTCIINIILCLHFWAVIVIQFSINDLLYFYNYWEGFSSFNIMGSSSMLDPSFSVFLWNLIPCTYLYFLFRSHSRLVLSFRQNLSTLFLIIFETIKINKNNIWNKF